MHDPGPAFRALHVPGDPFVLANAWDAGSALARAAHRVIVDAGEAMFGRGDFTALSRGISGDRVDALLARGAGDGIGPA